MLDQNLTTLLATMLGGFLSIVGGVAANFYMQRASVNSERKKELSSMITSIYKNTQKIMSNCAELDGGGWTGYDVKKAYEDLGINFDEIEMLIDLYFSEMKEDFNEYKEIMVKGLRISIKPDKNSPEYTVEDFPDIDTQEEATKKFRDGLRCTLQKMVQ